jgi:hypothetical protein
MALWMPRTWLLVLDHRFQMDFENSGLLDMLEGLMRALLSELMIPLGVYSFKDPL